MTNELSTLHLELAGLPTPAKKDFEFWRKHVEPVLRLPKGVGAALATIAVTTGVSIKTVERKFYAAKRGGLIALVDRRLAGPAWWKTNGQVGISEEDKALVRLYCDQNQRSSRSAIKKMRRDWLHGRIKSQTPVDERTGFPRGWSIDNLDRHKPTKFELKSVRLGRTAAASERPLVYTTRQGLWVGSHYMLDDMWHDFEVNSFAERQAGRPLELFSHDLFSARKMRWGIRVRTRKEDGSHHGLTRQMTRMIVAATLYLDGYSPRGTTMVVEHGAAGFEDRIAKLLLENSNGLITYSPAGMQGAAAHAGQYPGISRGNPRHKASLESSNNLTHNVFAALPGQTGLSRDRMPEEHQALMRHNEDLLAARNYLSPERAELLQFPILELQQFMAVAHELYRAIEEDTDHELEGWDLQTVNELLIGGHWMDQRQLNGPQAELALALIRDGGIRTRPRRMSRREVWQAGAGQLVRIPGHVVVEILGDDLATPRKVSKNRFEFSDREVGEGVHRYESLAFTPHGEALRLKDGETYETFVNPFAPDTLFVRRGNGAYIGECRRIEKPRQGDVAAVQRACGAAAKVEAELLAPVRARHLADAREKTGRHLHNARVLRGEAITMGERMQRLADREVEQSLTSADLAAATAHSAGEGEAETISPAAMAKYFGSAATNQTEGEENE